MRIRMDIGSSSSANMRIAHIDILALLIHLYTTKSLQEVPAFTLSSSKKLLETGRGWTKDSSKQLSQRTGVRAHRLWDTYPENNHLLLE